MFYLERRGECRKNVRDRILAGGDSNRRRAAFDMHLGARDRGEAAVERQRQPEHALARGSMPNDRVHDGSPDTKLAPTAAGTSNLPRYISRPATAIKSSLHPRPPS